MRLMVTGGSGFIGGNFIAHILSSEPEAEITNVDNLTYASIFPDDFGARFKGRYKFAKASILDSREMNLLCKDADMIVHFAAETHVDNSISRPRSFVETNVLGTASLLDSALKAGHRRFFHISTDEVYGSKEKGAFSETDPMRPSSPYSASKAGAEMMVLGYGKTYGLEATITRSSNNYGPRQHPEKFIPKTVARLLEGKKAPIYGNGKNVRDWLHVSDNCRAIHLLLKKQLHGEFNIASGVSLGNLELAGKIIRILGKDSGSLEFVEDRKGHDFRYAVDTAKIRRAGWAPLMQLEDGLKQTVDWYLANRKYWESHIV